MPEQKRQKENLKEEEVKLEKPLLKPKIDIVFQSLFSKENKEITKNFVQSLLGKKINKIEINNDKELFREKPDDKLGMLDLQLDIDNEEKIDVEIQLIDKHNIEQRLLYYWSKLYSSTIKIVDDYANSKRVVLIAILDYDLDLTKFSKEMQTQWMLRETKNPEKLLTDKLEIDIIELRKVKHEYEKNKDNKKAQWMMFLDDPNLKEVKEIMKKNKEIEDAVVVVHKMTEDEKMQRLADLREKAIMDEKAIRRAGVEEGREEGRKEGRKEGIKEGIKEGKLLIAKKMKEEKIDIETICRITELSKTEIEKL